LKNNWCTCFSLFTFHFSLLFLKVPILPCLEELAPGDWAEDIHGGRLAVMVVVAGLTAQIEVGVFVAVKAGAHLSFFQGFFGDVFSSTFLEFGGDVHRQEFQAEVIAARPGKNDCFGQVDHILGHELHQGVTVFL